MPRTADVQRLWSLPGGSAIEGPRHAMARTATAAASIVSIERTFISETAEPSYPGILPPRSMSATIHACMADQSTASKFFVHPHALCESTAIGENTRVWAFAHVLPGAKIGKEC